MTAAPTLEYGRSMTRRRRWFRRAIFLSLLVALVGYPSWRWGPRALATTRLLYWQNRCLNFIPARDQIAYEEDADAARKLLASGKEYSAYALNRTQYKDPAAAQTAAAYVPNCWTNFGALAGPSYAPWAGTPYGAVVFLHERVSPAGHRRLVMVRYIPETNTFNPYFLAGFNYDTKAITPATMTKPPAQPMRGYAIDVISTWPKVPPKVRMYCGTIDPADASHFTIRYEFWGKSDTLDGYLGDNDNITITPRKLPLDAQWEVTASTHR
jgi:hypothetical protein